MTYNFHLNFTAKNCQFLALQSVQLIFIRKSVYWLWEWHNTC